MAEQVTFSEIIEIIPGTLIQSGQEYSISTLLTDSRKPTNLSSAIFFAIKGANHDGHQYITELACKGVKSFIIEQVPSDPLPTKINVLLVKSSLNALQILAQHKREKYTRPVIAITGSNGKTIVKEWLSAMLSYKKLVLKSPKSYNSQLGVPLSVWELDEGHDIAVFEAGISQMEEMSRLKKVIQPTHGILTNIGTAHEEGFTSMRQKLREKLKLFVHTEVLVYSANNPMIVEEVMHMPEKPTKLVDWSFDSGSEIQVQLGENGQCSFHLQKERMHLKLPFTDKVSAENLIHCICMLKVLGHSPEYIQESLDSLEPVDMRLKLVKGAGNNYIIDDSYNNDLAGLESALNFLAHQNQYDKKAVILSDVPQVSDNASVYSRINQLLEERGVSKIIGVGPRISADSQRFTMDISTYPDTRALLKQSDFPELNEAVVLVKGARSFHFEQVVLRLTEKAHQTVLEINLDAITDNLNFYRSQLNSGVKIMAMVKALAYGSGSAEVAQLLQFHKVHYLAVAYADEGVNLRKNGIHLPIMVMNTGKADLEALIQHHLEPEVFDMDQLASFHEHYEGHSARLPVHININTGMNRMGFEPEEVDELIAFIHSHDNLEVRSIFTHLAGADEASHNNFSLRQIETFGPLAERISSQLKPKPLVHALNSAGIVRFPQHQMDMVRLGIGLYGLESSGQRAGELRTVGTLKTTVSQVKKVKAGETIGYSRKGLADQDMTIATVAIGYADGFSRGFSNGKGAMYIHGKPAPVVGNVCMDMTMLDVTGLDTKAGDQVTVFGQHPSISELAEQIGTIPYEILTSVSARVKRIYITE